ncbi:Diaminopimelate epimerase [Buchnera aphidicola (Tetraneura ulmi)]|uniref:diaminopimelate epimerase n=1 Tax=Buchnera aphidicola TaxID=9 RepID=UPI00346463CF
MFFSKMESLGNDFMVVDMTFKKYHFSTNEIVHLSNRNYGVGFDQLLLIEKSKLNNIDFFYRIFNANGEEVEQCGNGVRCFCFFLYKKKIIKKRIISVMTSKIKMICKILDNFEILVNMGKPNFIPKKIPFLANEEKKIYSLKIFEEKVYFSVVSIGNPHCVLIVNEIDTYNVKKIGSILEKHNLFPNKVNVGFFQILSRNKIILRVYERGVGETKSCGSGACAAVAVGIIRGLLDSKVSVILEGGVIKIFWKGLGHSLFMSGPANHVYDGLIYL